jgi:hypothetical protein
MSITLTKKKVSFDPSICLNPQKLDPPKKPSEWEKSIRDKRAPNIPFSDIYMIDSACDKCSDVSVLERNLTMHVDSQGKKVTNVLDNNVNVSVVRSTRPFFL